MTDDDQLQLPLDPAAAHSEGGATTKPTKSQFGKSSFSTTQDLLSKYQLDDKGGYITREFQDYGYRLAVELDDLEHKSLYMKLAKTQNRGHLERALSYVKDANARSKAKLFMWKLKQLRQEDSPEDDDSTGQLPLSGGSSAE